MASANKHLSSVVGNGSVSGVTPWQFEDLLNCMICFESFRNPKMLPCGHTFCAECLVGYQKTYEQQRRAVPGKLPCPTCRELTTLPPGGVSGLRNDFKVQKIEDLFRTMNVKHRQKQPARQGSEFCATCQAQNKKTKVRLITC
jgi:RING-type zinc-finger